MGSLLRELYYITHVDNLKSIISKGILSHELVNKDGVAYTPVYDADIVNNRNKIPTPDGKTLWNFANLYFQPRNPMLYRVTREKGVSNIAIVSIKKQVLTTPGAYVTTGNAANYLTSIKPVGKIDHIQEIENAVNMEWWNDQDGSKRKIMVECLIPEKVPPSYIESIYVANHDLVEKVKEMISPSSLLVIPDPHLFFHSEVRSRLNPLIQIVEGDMFFTRLQTITISVNCVGIMGKGIASRAKYQFPDVYVLYQDLCRKKQIQLGKPWLYKRESSYDYELADHPETLKNGDQIKWFLLFATKDHWRQNANLEGIKKGLEWLVANYRDLGITSLALPALGCGLGNLDWKDVGPLMCQYLSKLDIPVWIYLPLEKRIPDTHLSVDFLLKKS